MRIEGEPNRVEGIEEEWAYRLELGVKVQELTKVDLSALLNGEEKKSQLMK